MGLGDPRTGLGLASQNAAWEDWILLEELCIHLAPAKSERDSQTSGLRAAQGDMGTAAESSVVLRGGGDGTRAIGCGGRWDLCLSEQDPEWPARNR